MDFPILPGVFSKCENWFITLWEEKMLRVLEKRILMKVLEHKMQQPIRMWQDMHKEHHCLCSSKYSGGQIKGTERRRM
jgi:hypothetical protein